MKKFLFSISRLGFLQNIIQLATIPCRFHVKPKYTDWLLRVVTEANCILKCGSLQCHEKKRFPSGSTVLLLKNCAVESPSQPWWSVKRGGLVVWETFSFFVAECCLMSTTRTHPYTCFCFWVEFWSDSIVISAITYTIETIINATGCNVAWWFVHLVAKQSQTWLSLSLNPDLVVRRAIYSKLTNSRQKQVGLSHLPKMPAQLQNKLACPICAKSHFVHFTNRHIPFAMDQKLKFTNRPHNWATGSIVCCCWEVQGTLVEGSHSMILLEGLSLSGMQNMYGCQLCWRKLENVNKPPPGWLDSQDVSKAFSILQNHLGFKLGGTTQSNMQSNSEPTQMRDTYAHGSSRAARQHNLCQVWSLPRWLSLEVAVSMKRWSFNCSNA